MRKSWVYGPVLSRRFGLSLGVDLVPEKLCSYDCIYCQLGRTTRLEAHPSHWVDAEDVVRDVEAAVKEVGCPDVVTLAGSGEPTLYDDLGHLIKRLRETTDAPVLMLTNAGLLFKKDVAEAAMEADILAPSLDAGDPKTFSKLNRPHKDITFENMLRGLQEVTNSFKGMVRLEIMLVRGVNDSEKSLNDMARILETLRVDRIDVNTPVRPVGGKPVLEKHGVAKDEDNLIGAPMICSQALLEKAAALFGPKAVVVASRREPKPAQEGGAQALSKDGVYRLIKETISRRPSSAPDLCDGLGLREIQVLNALTRLRREGLLVTRGVEVSPEEVGCVDGKGNDSDAGVYYFVDS